jgi:hypothetical protein
VLAAAQHHGVPTRLLDWSKRSFVAAYFAASSANQNTYASHKISVWALNTSSSQAWQRLRIIDPPGGTSKNLAAQSGIFTMQVNSDLYDDLYRLIPLEDEDEIYSFEKDVPPFALYKISLPVSEVPKLIQLCAKFGVSGTTLFPGYEGVAKDVQEWAKEQVGMRIQLNEEAYSES